MCPLDSCQGSIGNCKFCSSKSECILIAILEKLANLESMMAIKVHDNNGIGK